MHAVTVDKPAFKRSTLVSLRISASKLVGVTGRVVFVTVFVTVVDGGTVVAGLP